MKLERLPEYVTTFTAVVVGGLVSYWFGILAGEGSIGTILSVMAGFALVALLLSLRSDVWVLVPIIWPFAGQLPQVKLHLALRDVAMLSVLVTLFMLTAVKALRFKPKLRALDFWLWATIFWVLLAYVRHPTGGLILQSDRIGGRAYLNTALAIAAYYILSRSIIPVRWKGQGFFYAVLGGEFAQAFLYMLTHFGPSAAARILPYYNGVDSSGLDMGGSDAPGDTGPSTERQFWQQSFAQPLQRFLISTYPPNTLLSLLYPLRGLAFFVVLLVSLTSGFRSNVITVGAYFIIASALRQGVLSAARIIVVGLIGLTLLVASSYFIHLPVSMQRSLSFLPGRWESIAVADAANSTEWRLYMWRLMLTGNRYIENKWIGDGFGFSMRQFEQMQQDHSELATQENFMIVGQVHSGPVSTIRFVGYIGLALYTCLLIAMAREGWILCRMALKTSLGPLALYFCLPIIWEPVNFHAVFGSYDYSMPNQVYWAGLLKVLRHSLEAREAHSRQDQLEEAKVRPAVVPRERVVRPGRPAITVPLP